MYYINLSTIKNNFFEPFSIIITILSSIYLYISFIKTNKKIYINFQEDYFEYSSNTHHNQHNLHYKNLNTKYSKLKYQLKYNNIKEWGNIKHLNKKIYKNKVFNIGFITNDNKKYYINVYDFSENTLKQIIDILNKKIKINPNKEIIINKNSLKGY